MRKISLLLLILIAPGCASEYWKDRGNDFVDILTLGAEFPGFGFSAKAGPFATGLGYEWMSVVNDSEMDALGFGLLGRHAGPYYVGEVNALVWGITGFGRMGPEPMSEDTMFRTWHQMLFVDGHLWGDGRRIDRYTFTHFGPMGARGHWMHLGQVEGAAGFGPYFRAGANVLEVFDFVFGWTTWDFAGDDAHFPNRPTPDD